MIDTVSLKASLIDLAVSGRLSTEFQAEDSINGIIRNLPAPSNKRKKLLGQTFDYGKQIDIPNKWRWMLLGEISSYGDTPVKANSATVSDNTWILDLEDIKSGGELITKTRANEKQFVGEKTAFKSGQVLYSKLRPYLKKVLVADEDGISTPELISFDVFGGILPQYVVYCLLDSFTNRAIDKRSYGIKMPRIDVAFMVNLPVPVPPVSEQQYIIERLEKAFTLIDTVDSLQGEYDSNKKALKRKLIDAAIQGKLTEQLPEDGDAEDLYAQIQEEKTKLIKEGKIKKEKPSPEISDDEVPFEIPDNWKWVHMGDVFEHNTGKALNNADKNGVKLEYITTSNMYWDHFELDNLKCMFFKESEIEKCTITKGDLLICEGGDIGRSAIWTFDYDMRIQNHIHRLRGYCGIVHKYYYYVMRNYKDMGMIDGRGIGLQGFSSKRVHSLVVPLPPLEEQKRIVEKIQGILSAL